MDIAGETFSEPPQFRVWLDGYPQPPILVTAAAELERGKPLTWADPPSLNAQSFVFEIPAKLSALEIEFINDDWDPETGLDRNLGILGVQIGNENLPLSCFRISAGYEHDIVQSDTLLLFIRNGTVRVELPCHAGKAS